MQFDFQRYIQERKRNSTSTRKETPRGYAFGRDTKVSGTLGRAKPVKMALEATSNLDAERLREGVLAARQTDAESDAWLHQMVARAVTVLGMAEAPKLYITEQSGDFDAQALVIDSVASIVLDRALLDILDEDEMLFTIGQQCGHIHQEHALFLTADFAMEHVSEEYMRWVVSPARYAIGAWRRHGNVTADRAGMLACGEMQVAAKALLKRHGAGSLPTPLDMEIIMEEAEDNPRGSYLAALVHKAPQVPGRLLALKAFADAEIFRRACGRDGGLSMTSVDRQVESIIKIW